MTKIVFLETLESAAIPGVQNYSRRTVFQSYRVYRDLRGGVRNSVSLYLSVLCYLSTCGCPLSLPLSRQSGWARVDLALLTATPPAGRVMQPFFQPLGC